MTAPVTSRVHARPRNSGRLQHLVDVDNHARYTLPGAPALCGLSPKAGWVFLPLHGQMCPRCYRKAKAGA